MDMICLACGKQFEARRRAVEKGEGRYCSLVCSASQHKNPAVSCPICGTVFNPTYQPHPHFLAVSE